MLKNAYRELFWLSIVKQAFVSADKKIQEKSKKKLTQEEQAAFEALAEFKTAMGEYKNNYPWLKEKEKSSLNKQLKKIENLNKLNKGILRGKKERLLGLFIAFRRLKHCYWRYFCT